MITDELILDKPLTAIRVLIVEDSIIQAQMLKRILEKEGYDTAIAKNGTEGLSMAGKYLPNLVISDILMPEMDGFDLCRKIKADLRFKEVSVVLLTSLSSVTDIVKGLSCEADDFITKPYEESYLLSRIRKITDTQKRRKGEERRPKEMIDLMVAGENYRINANRNQMIDFLVSAYETAVSKNNDLIKAEEKLKTFNMLLEKKVDERTEALHKKINEQKAIEDELRKSEARLKQLNQNLSATNRELEQVAYVAAHDLQEPLRMVASYVQLLEKRYKYKLDQDALDYINYAVEGSIRMKTLINDLLMFLNIKSRGKNFEKTDMSAVLRETISNLEPVIDENKAVVTKDALPEVWADKGQMKQLFRHLIQNAISYRSDVPPQIHISAVYEHDQWVFSVKDNGRGIDPRFFDRIFIIFQQLQRKTSGTGNGIGLAICKKIVERHQGCIWVESELEKGATFSFTLPHKENNEKC